MKTKTIIASGREMKASLATILLATMTLSSWAADTNAFADADAGLAIVKPRDWVFVTPEQHIENLKRSTLKDEELMKWMREHPRIPLVMMMKYREPFDDLNPNLRIDAVARTGAMTNNLTRVMERLMES